MVVSRLKGERTRKTRKEEPSAYSLFILYEEQCKIHVPEFVMNNRKMFGFDIIAKGLCLADFSA